VATEIEVKVFATLREVMDHRTIVDLEEGATTGDLLDTLISRNEKLEGMLFDDHGELRPYVNILKNGRNIRFIDGFATPLADGDVAAIFPPAGGG